MEEIFLIVGDDYKVISQYKRTTKSLDIWHTQCNSKFLIKPVTHKKPRTKTAIYVISMEDFKNK